jgi:hypothetical protein
MFHLFQMNVASVLSGCWKSRSRCCIYMHVASIRFKCFQVFHTYVCNCFIWILHMSAMFFRRFRKCFICLATVASGCFKSRSRVAHDMRVGSGRRHRRHPGRCGTTSGALSRRSFAPCAGSVLTLARLRPDRSLDASKPEDQFLSYGILFPAYDFMEK